MFNCLDRVKCEVLSHSSKLYCGYINMCMTVHNVCVIRLTEYCTKCSIHVVELCPSREESILIYSKTSACNLKEDVYGVVFQSFSRT